MSAERPAVVIPPESAASGTELLPATAADPDRPGAAAAAEVVARVRAELPQMAGLGQREELLAAAWLMSQRSARTRRAYAGDLWRGWAGSPGMVPTCSPRAGCTWTCRWPGSRTGGAAAARACVPLDQAPRGLAWLFSLLACTCELAENRTPNLILLLDDPGQSLHGRAQLDLLGFIEDRLATSHQVLYTTHSPFMVPRDLRRLRTVIDHDNAGTRISAEISEADEATVLPLTIETSTEMAQKKIAGARHLLGDGQAP